MRSLPDGNENMSGSIHQQSLLSREVAKSIDLEAKRR